MLPGIHVRDIKNNSDDRGSFAEILREDWADSVRGDKIVQSNLSFSWPGTVRAWHRHQRGQVDYLIVLKGTVKICAYDDEDGSATRGNLDEILVSEEKLQLVRIPGHYWHGTKTLSADPSTTIYFVTKLYNSRDPDEQRRPWSDSAIIDPRTKKPYDWSSSFTEKTR